MADQRDQTIYATARRQDQDPDLAAIMADPANHSWRTFQLAFILLNLPALTDPKHPERGEIADLLWFPPAAARPKPISAWPPTQWRSGVCRVCRAIARAWPAWRC